MSYELHNADCYEYIKQIPDKSIDLVYIDIPYLIENSGKEIKKSPLAQRIQKTNGELEGYSGKEIKKSPLAQRIQKTNGELEGYSGKEIKKLQELKDAMINAKSKNEYEKYHCLHSNLLNRLNLKHANIVNGIDYGILDELCRVMKNIYIYIWCSKAQIYDLMKYFVGEKKCRFNLLVWCKTNCVPATNNSFLPNIEHCLVFKSDGAPKYNDGYELKSKWYISGTNKADKDEYDHPTIKPLELVKRHILHSTQPNDVVLDCFMGSGTTGVACVETNRNFIGIEIDPHYFQIAENRLKGYSQRDIERKKKGQIDLFDLMEV